MRLPYGLLITVCLLTPAFLQAQDTAGFTGTWRRDVPDSAPKHNSNAPRELRIKMEGDMLTVIMMGASEAKKVDVHYQLGGPAVNYTGLDGDQFHMSVKREGNSLVFDGKERERGSEHPVHETWTLKEKSEGQVLQTTKNAKDPNEPPHAMTEYERVKQ